jgi:hypothetical protein
VGEEETGIEIFVVVGLAVATILGFGNQASAQAHGAGSWKMCVHGHPGDLRSVGHGQSPHRPSSAFPDNFDRVRERMSLQSVQLSLVLFGAVCIIAAIVGGNIKLPGVQVGPIASEDAREGLGILGFALLGASYFLPQWYSTGPTKEAYAHKLNNLCHQVSEAFPIRPRGIRKIWHTSTARSTCTIR